MSTDETPRPIEDIYAELASHPDFVVGGYLSREHVGDRYDLDLIFAYDFVVEGMSESANEELWDIVREGERSARRHRDGETGGGDFW